MEYTVYSDTGDSTLDQERVDYVEVASPECWVSMEKTRVREYRSNGVMGEVMSNNLSRRKTLMKGGKQ
jgi:hypothetical protein